MIGRGILLLVVELVTNALKHARSGDAATNRHLACGCGRRGFELVVGNTGSDATSAVAAKPAIGQIPRPVPRVARSRCRGRARILRSASERCRCAG